MEIIKTDIEGVLILKPHIFGDARGYFYESYNKKLLSDLAPEIPEFVQDNQSYSTYGVVRGLHFQKAPYAQAKLVRVVSGKVLDVAVDLRAGSPTFGKHVSVELSGENHLQFFIPEGFAHGFSVLSHEVVFQYKCSSFYNKESEGGIIFNDPDLGIDWGIPQKDMILSPKDKVHPTFAQYIKSL
ncbi:MAG: dTDP-4-dehydrorhamnose 3,5-epimerase [Bacteroidales bacterium]|jgi:dTDP-4-dehydrorhamnose 3,5-epimerase|nr:dTDP-4-dehydrorhamnose 3,5-epimerase [Bacteroidales bacterium]MBR6972658.1 dTDP-4-dehydrorhamnose 3,5-epimerase [Bacteroidales bacterium]